MSQRKCWALAAFLGFWASCSYSDPYTYGYTGNAAAYGHSWAMPTAVPGMDINAVLYRYTTLKDRSAAMTVSIQNRDTQGTGYIFREVDDWTNLPGNTISKVISVNNIPISRWGDGEIQVTGQGSVVDATVIYSYRIDTCFTPQLDPSCPGYRAPLPDVPEVYSALDDEAVRNALETPEREIYQEEKTEPKQKETKERTIASKKDPVLEAMIAGANIAPYYTLTIPGGVYKDSVVLRDTRLPDNRRGLLNGLAQQKLHEQLIDLQYRR